MTQQLMCMNNHPSPEAIPPTEGREETGPPQAYIQANGEQGVQRCAENGRAQMTVA